MRYTIVVRRIRNGEAVTVHIPCIHSGFACHISEVDREAKEAILWHFESHQQRKEKSPLSEFHGNYGFVDIGVSAYMKVLLNNAFLDAEITKAELGRRVGMRRQEINMVFDYFHETKADTIQKCINALGKRLSVKIVD